MVVLYGGSRKVMDMGTYLVVDRNNVIRNNIEWDGKSDYSSGDGLRLVAYDGPAGAGWKWDGAAATAIDQNSLSPMEQRKSQSGIRLLAMELGMTPEALVAKLMG